MVKYTVKKTISNDAVLRHLLTRKGIFDKNKKLNVYDSTFSK